MDDDFFEFGENRGYFKSLNDIYHYNEKEHTLIKEEKRVPPSLRIA